MDTTSVDFGKDKDFSVLLQAAGEQTESVSVIPRSGGGNNRVFVIQANSRRYIAKQYFVHPSDKRDRLQAEYKFLEYARCLGLRCVPEPLAHILKNHIGLYEFIEGRPIQAYELAPRHIEEAINFFLSLNSPARFGMKDVLPDASEACFSISNQIAMVRQRIARLSNIIPTTPIDKAVFEFVNHLKRVFEKTAIDVIEASVSSGMNVDEVLALEYRCISPSDFGFHNALLGGDNKVYFLDFEYAGWDDPAKMACDFFCHPAVPVDIKYFDNFLQKVMSFSSNPALLINRALITLPLYRIKWCCIILNEFLPESARRRRFADPDTDPEERKLIQLDKAYTMLNKFFPLGVHTNGLH